MERSDFGRYIACIAGSEDGPALVPAALPPVPALQPNGRVRHSLDQGLLALGRLDGVTGTLPDAHLLLPAYVRKEAVLSSQIEGIHSTLDDLLVYELGETPGAPVEDIASVSRYVAAISHGLQRLRGGFPLSCRLLFEMHGVLFAAGRDAQKTPGGFKQSQNGIGGTHPGPAAFVPPAPQDIGGCMGEFEKFLHSDTPALVKAALAHLQFETIHPFRDGNGRIGRSLVTLLLCHEGILREPLLYPSLYFHRDRQRYCAELTGARESGDLERWLEFFATAIRVSAEEAVRTAQRISALFQEDRARVRSSMGRLSRTLPLVHEALQAKPLATIAALTRSTGLTTPTVTQALRQLESLGIVRETTGRARGRIFAYVHYLRALNAETATAAA